MGKQRKSGTVWNWLAPALVGLTAIVGWDMFVRITDMPPYLLPGPGLVLKTLVEEWGDLFPSLLVTIQITVLAFLQRLCQGY